MVQRYEFSGIDARKFLGKVKKCLNILFFFTIITFLVRELEIMLDEVQGYCLGRMVCHGCEQPIYS